MNAVLVLALLIPATLASLDTPIGQWLTDQGNYTQMVQLLKLANVYTTLQGSGPITVFAVPDSAFGSVPTATMTNIITNRALLDSFIKYHVIVGSFIIEPMMQDGSLRDTLNGKPLLFTKFANHSVAVDGTIISKGDYIANNGVVHVLARPLLSVTETIAEQLINDEHQLQDFLMVLMVTQQISRLMNGNWTLFAPSNAAIAAVSSQIPDFDNHDAAIAYYTAFVNRHLVNKTLYTRDLHDGDILATAAHTTLIVHVTGTDVTVSGARVTDANVVASNGVTHVIDAAFFH